MGVREKIEADLKEAMKARDGVRVDALRFVLSAMKNKWIELRDKFDDSTATQVLSSLAKQRKESIEQFEKGGRTELAAKEKAELAILEAYLPRALNEDELEGLINAAIKESGATSPKDMGKVMKALLPKTAGRVDGKLLSQSVQKKLAG